MTLENFRIMHSTLIENYQYIEFHLEGIYAALAGKSFIAGLKDVETSNIAKLIVEIKKLESAKQVSNISQLTYDRIEQARARRNYWCHNCYVDMCFKNNGDPKKEKDVKALMNDLREAENLREDLFEIKQSLMRDMSPV